MKIINRRDYLCQMSAALGTIMCFPKVDLLARSLVESNQKLPRARSARVASYRPLTWEPQWSSELIGHANAAANEVVKLIFYGLNGFAKRNGSTGCDVGFHSAGDANHHHRLSVVAYSGTSCTTVYDQPATKVESLALQVPNVSDADPRYRNGVSFFEPTYPHPVLKRAHLTNPNDFRWIVDFDSDYLYGKFFTGGQQSVEINSNVYKPAFSVPYGIFYTLHKTTNRFWVITENGLHQSFLGPVADWTAANIYVEPNTSVTLRVNGSDYHVQAPGEIYFLNICYGDPTYTTACESTPNHPIKEKRGDFFLNYKAFRRPNAAEYQLWRSPRRTPAPLDLDLRCFGQATRIMPVHTQDKGHRKSRLLPMITDESPCSGAGYGGGNGIPPYPPVR
ncbi:MAG TPA: hypothetical protein VIT88_10940 [Pyrinomonadaceae bacterium]